MATIDIERNWLKEHQQQKQQNACRRRGSDSTFPTMQRVESLTEDNGSIVRQQIAEILAERDEQWDKRQRAEMEFVKRESERLAGKMQREMDRLHAVNRELERRLFVEASNLAEQFQRELSTERATNAELRHELALAVKRSARLAQLVERSANVQRERAEQWEAKLADQRDQIRMLNNLLVVKTKSRSIGPTTSAHCLPSRLHQQRRSQSGECAERTEPPMPTAPSAVAAWCSVAEQQPLGIDAPPPLPLFNERHRKRESVPGHQKPKWLLIQSDQKWGENKQKN